MKQKDLKPYVGSMQQLAEIRTSVLDDGKGRGMRIADMDNGSGLSFTILPDRGMDIGKASFKGIPFAYMTPVGYVNAEHFEADGLQWLRSFTGGLLTGCGLRNAGAPVEGLDPEEVCPPLGLHGRLSNTPAEEVSVRQQWQDDRYELEICGTVRESCFYRENLELRRSISTAMGNNSITITDTVTNLGVRPSPLMLLYHINIGYPLLNENATLSANVAGTIPRNETAAKAIDTWMQFHEPVAGMGERCFFHDIEADNDGMARMTLNSPDTGLALEIAYRKAEIPFFTQWKQLGEQEYVVGLEPANCHPDGQAEERKNGTLRIIEPEETIEHKVIISVREL